MTEIKTNGHTLIVVPVPEDSESFSLELNTLRCSNKNGFYDIDVLPGCWTEKQQLESLEVMAKVLGFVTPSEISFEIEPYIEYWDSVANDGTKVYQRYPDEIPKCRTASDSFRSLLAANGIDFDKEKKYVVLLKK